MTRDIRDDLEPHDADELLPVAEVLHARRPVPRAAFRGDLRRMIISDAARARPARLWARIALSGTSGLGLLGVAALGVLGVGPFAA